MQGVIFHLAAPGTGGLGVLGSWVTDAVSVMGFRLEQRTCFPRMVIPQSVRTAKGMRSYQRDSPPFPADGTDVFQQRKSSRLYLYYL